MLTITRKVGERIIIGEDVKIQVMEIRQAQVRLGTEAHPLIPIDREEVRIGKMGKGLLLPVEPADVYIFCKNCKKEMEQLDIAMSGGVHFGCTICRRTLKVS